MSSSLSWGPVVATPPPAGLDPADGLQPIVDAMTAGQVYDLPAGTFYADPGNPTTPLTIGVNAYGLVLRGVAQDHTLIGSPILMATGRLGLERLWVRANGADYGVKIYNGGSPFIARCHMDNVGIGASSKAAAEAGLGPRDGLIIDGAGVFLAHKATIGFNRRHGLICDSTGAEPNTTLKFDMCSFVQNGFGPAEVTGVGIKLEGSLGIAEFNGGNCEGNKYGEATANNMNNLRFRDFDFETTLADQTGFTDQLTVGACNPVLIDNCTFFRGGLVAGGVATRAMAFATCVGVRILPNRYSGWTNVGIIRLDENCQNCWVEPIQPNADNGGCWVEDYSR